MPISKCATCDYEWVTGQDGGHSCTSQLKARLEAITAEVVIDICNAYESGVGHGLKKDGLGSPYSPGDNEDAAYKFGYEFGGRSVK